MPKGKRGHERFQVVYVINGERRSIECDGEKEAHERARSISAAAAIKGQPHAPVKVIRMMEGPVTLSFDRQDDHT